MNPHRVSHLSTTLICLILMVSSGMIGYTAGRNEVRPDQLLKPLPSAYELTSPGLDVVATFELKHNPNCDQDVKYTRTWEPPGYVHRVEYRDRAHMNSTKFRIISALDQDAAGVETRK